MIDDDTSDGLPLATVVRQTFRGDPVTFIRIGAHRFWVVNHRLLIYRDNLRKHLTVGDWIPATIPASFRELYHDSMSKPDYHVVVTRQELQQLLIDAILDAVATAARDRVIGEGL